ncbi:MULTISPECIES: hypothetical protein [Streptomyces]|uniref:Lipoprotein n=1 Tax=Streptomyces albus (strain ATCC 21838 / DSM 41398 / FERM P-419 / JCM 4703 / NBRC 107858) TaxID=1081613 RepID=A0A0B5F7J7_STRA4|nr:hypothetical protein [Streptomyces sp. SCSIO ZS0520]AJE86432.1 hypothetical protein SLNWT_6056 [Streptomyces albus]AOU80734.1 hypothetical protein SLNHY_6043 [Streptomyces albus]AYN36441.1 hypothetical protein DUI70_5947 [Streptomyces albus]
MDDRQEKSPKSWTGAEKWQVWLGLLGLLVAITGCVGQFVQ